MFRNENKMKKKLNQLYTGIGLYTIIMVFFFAFLFETKNYKCKNKIILFFIAQRYFLNIREKNVQKTFA